MRYPVSICLRKSHAKANPEFKALPLLVYFHSKIDITAVI